MKQLRYFMQLLLAAVLLTGCSDEFFETNGTNKGEDGPPVTFTFGVELPEAVQTRVFGDEAPNITINSLYVIVFDNNHYIKQIAEAVPDSTGTNGEFLPENETDEDQYTKFNVTLNSSDETRIVHLIANYPDAANLSYGQEGQIIGALKSTTNQDIYWQRVEGVPIKISDNPSNLANPQSDNQDDPVRIVAPPQLQRVPLVRNYAQISVELDDQYSGNNFKLLNYALTNVPDCGSVAPRVAGNRFARYWEENGGEKVCRSYENITNDIVDGVSYSFSGNIPYDVNYIPMRWSQEESAENPNGVLTLPISYVFEHKNVDNTKPMSVIIKGMFRKKNEQTNQWGDYQETYYKIDLIYKKNNINTYYNVLRNFKYKVVIKDIVDVGYDTPEEAAEKPASNNLSGSVEVSTYKSISDGIHQLMVDQADIYVVRGGTYSFKFSYNNDITATSPAIRNDLAGVSVGSTTPAGADAIITNGPNIAGNDEGEWRTVTFTASDPVTGVDKTQEIYVTTPSLTRTVKVHLIQPYTMTVTCDPSDVQQTINTPVNVKVTLPAGLPKSIFPLQFFISTKDNTLYPQANTGMAASVQDGKYGFIRILERAEYEKIIANNGGVMDCLFMTNSTNSGTEVYVENTYFNQGSKSFSSNTPCNLASVSFQGTERFGKNHRVYVRFSLKSNQTVTITFKEAGATDQTWTTTNNTDYTYSQYTEKTVWFETKTFKGDISVVVKCGTDANATTITLVNPKKRHLLYIPAGSFTFDASVAGGYEWDNEANNGAGGYVQATDGGGVYEWPSFYVDGIRSGSKKMYPTTGTVESISIDETYGGREVTFNANSVFEFVTYYNYDENGNLREGFYVDTDGDGVPDKIGKVASCTLQDLCDKYSATYDDVKGTILTEKITMNLDFQTPVANSGGAKPAWFGYHAPAKKRK